MGPISKATRARFYPFGAPSGNDRYLRILLRTPAIADPSNDRRGPSGEREVGSFEMGAGGPLLGLSAVPVHPSLMKQFQSRLLITETGTVSQIPIVAMETISQSQCATLMAPLTLCQRCQGVPS